MVGGTLRTTTNFFLGHRVKTTMSTNMTQVRSILPARLRGARFATIARDPAFRRYFASGDDSATIRGVLKQLYGAAGNTKRSAALDRQLAREARSRRALVGARQRRHRAQNVAQALAPVVQAADSRAQRLANREARARALNLLRRRQLAFRAARNPVGADLAVRYQKLACTRLAILHRTAMDCVELRSTSTNPCRRNGVQKASISPFDTIYLHPMQLVMMAASSILSISGTWGLHSAWTVMARDWDLTTTTT